MENSLSEDKNFNVFLLPSEYRPLLAKLYFRGEEICASDVENSIFISMIGCEHIQNGHHFRQF